MRKASRSAAIVGFALAGIALGSVSASAATFSNPAPIVLPSVGNATPYPSQITVTGQTAPISDLNVNLNGLSHDAPSDIQGPLLVAPGGQTLLLMACVGGDGAPFPPAVNVNLKLDDSSGVRLPAFPSAVPSGTYKPTNYCGSPPSFPSPGPLASYGNPGPGSGGTSTLASTFNTANANGTWSLFVRDGFSGGSVVGEFAGGWSLEISPDPATKKKCKKGRKLKKGKCVKKKRKKKKKQ